jgi:hypothetical protein
LAASRPAFQAPPWSAKKSISYNEYARHKSSSGPRATNRRTGWRPAAHSIYRHRMTAPDEMLTPDSSDDLAAELAFALRFQGRKPVEIIARVPHHHRGSRRERMLSPATERKRTKRTDTELEAVGDQRALSHCEIKIVVRLPSRRFQAAATASRHVVIAAARSTRCV